MRLVRGFGGWFGGLSRKGKVAVIALALFGGCTALASLSGPSERERPAALPTATATLAPTPTPTSTAQPTATLIPTLTPRPTPTLAVGLDEDSWLIVYRTVLEQYGVTVQYAQIADGRASGGERVLIVGYQSSAREVIDLFEEIGYMLGPTDRDDIDLDALTVMIGDAAGNVAAVVVIKVRDYKAWKAGRLGNDEFLARWTIEQF